MNLVGLALRNLKRRPVRTSLSILGIGLAVGSALALISLSHSIRDSTREGLDENGDDLVVMQKGVGSSRVDLQACKLEYSIVSPK